LLALVVVQGLGHVEYRLHQLAQVGRFALALADPAEGKQSFGDVLAAKGFFLDHLEVV